MLAGRRGALLRVTGTGGKLDTVSSTPCVSVVVPFFNSGRHIQACIDALLDQEDVDAPYELIFVNNGSSDDSASIVERTAGVVALKEDTAGAYAARNTGIRAAKAPLVAFTDADCTVDCDWIRTIRDAMVDPSLALLVGHFRYPSHASSALRLLGAYENAKTDYVLSRCPPSQHFAYANNMVVRRSVFEELGLFKEWKRASDTEFVHRVAMKRPDLRLAYCRAMRITHLEFASARARARRLLLYQRTNSKVGSFEELGSSRRLAALTYLLRRGEKG